MADIFISYARADRGKAELLANRLEYEGWSVFWDLHLRSGEPYSRALDKELRAADAVVALWSPRSVESDWVVDEARLGLDLGKLAPAWIEKAALPLGLAGLHVSDLTGWDGNADTPDLKELLHRLTEFCGPPRLMSILPEEVHIVLGRPKIHPSMGATLNLVCNLESHVDRAITLQWVQGHLSGPGAVYDFNWHLIFDVEGPLEHKQKVAESTAVTVLPDGMRQGIQIRSPAFGAGVTWPSGDYTLDLRGWVNRGFGGDGHNTETRVTLRLTEPDAAWVAHWQTATDDVWVAAEPTDNAIGIPFPIVKTGFQPDG